MLPGRAVAAPTPEVYLQHPTRLDHPMSLDASSSTLAHIAQTGPLAPATPAPAAWTPALVPAKGAYGQALIARASPSPKLLHGLMGTAAQHHTRALAAACVTSGSSISQDQHRLPRKLLQPGLSHLHMTEAPDHTQAAARPTLYSRKLLQEDAASPAGNSPELKVAHTPAAGRVWPPVQPMSTAAASTSDSTATSHAQEPGTAAAAAVLAANSSAPPLAPDSTASSSAWTALDPGLAAAAGALAASSMPAGPLPTMPPAPQSPSALSLGLDMDGQQHKQILIVIGEQSGMSKSCFACLPCLM